MSVVDTFLKKMRMVSDDDYEDYDDDYDDYAGEADPDEDIISSKRVKDKKKYQSYDFDDFDMDDELGDQPKRASAKAQKSAKTVKPQKNSDYSSSYSSGITSLHTVRKEDSMNNVCMIMPKGFEDANLIADKLTEGCGVVMNLEGIDMNAAQRIIDFASGACYAVNGNLQKISKKIFMAVPGDVNLSGDFDDLIDDMVGLNSVSMK